MTWQESINDIKFKIITGDGKPFEPKWNTAEKTQEYNTTVFDFVNVAGSYVDRRAAKARRFDLEFYFDGENCLEKGNEFEYSARDRRIWIITHPYYGTIKGHPISLKQDNSLLNVSKFNVPFVESEVALVIDKVRPANTLTPITSRGDGKLNNGLNKVELKKSVAATKKTYTEQFKDGWQYGTSQYKAGQQRVADFKRAVSVVENKIDNVIFDAVDVIREINSLLIYPAQVYQNMRSKLGILFDSVDTLISNFGIFDRLDDIDKIITGELTISQVLSAIPFIAITPPEDIPIGEMYSTRTEIYELQKILSDILVKYIETLESIQHDDFVPDYVLLNTVVDNINIASIVLFDIAQETRQEREFICDRDTNLLLLTHRFYGLDKNDENINKFISSNNIGLSEILSIKSGRKVVYYV